ncbi:hypothetical protein [Streptomyces qinzhouensis]|uniref:hypothetical protein n=1 Tax=Streptomyces qinzhouensis TaxID=2599401 RepID=UPI001645CA92|nr:hypothetical protein [Streptomyces qinzhouensis]
MFRWLRGQALSLADRLDPDPAQVTWASVLHPEPATRYSGIADVPWALRAWAANGANRRDERRLAAGIPVFMLRADRTGSYAFIAWPVGPGTTPPDDALRWLSAAGYEWSQ